MATVNNPIMGSAKFHYIKRVYTSGSGGGYLVVIRNSTSARDHEYVELIYEAGQHNICIQRVGYNIAKKVSDRRYSKPG
jgi:hypothetical protein